MPATVRSRNSNATTTRGPRSTPQRSAAAKKAPVTPEGVAQPEDLAPARRRTTKGTGRSGFLRRLGIFGYDHLEPVLLAALATSDPLLLIGAHGTAKSLLLLRLGEALGLQTRHYNASLLNYEDLAGYPLPDASGGLQFIQTPASIWGAEAVFLDEISRCRIDMQNRLFPVIHERKVQGILLDKLRYRWAAMNPPPPADDLDAALYRGSEKLDSALADRFAFVLETPSWASLEEEDRNAVISSVDGPVPVEVALEVRSLVADTAALRESVETEYRAGLVDYVRTVLGLLGQARIALSPRRAAILYRNAIAAISAARVLWGADADLADVVHLVLSTSLPQRAEGTEVPALTVLTCHREAWKLLERGLDHRRRVLLGEPSPLRRALLALGIEELEAAEFSAFVADAVAESPAGARHALAVHLLEGGQAGRLTAAVADQVARLHAHAVVAQDITETLAAGSLRHLVWQELVRVLAALDPASRRDDLLGNVLSALFAANELVRVEDPATVAAAWNDTWAQLAEKQP